MRYIEHMLKREEWIPFMDGERRRRCLTPALRPTHTKPLTRAPFFPSITTVSLLFPPLSLLFSRTSTRARLVVRFSFWLSLVYFPWVCLLSS